MDKRIKLHRRGGMWVATHFGDPSVRELFGTDTLPTPYLSSADAFVVLRAVVRLNPGIDVTIVD